MKWFDLKTFDVEEYEYLYHHAVCNINIMCPKFVAFAGPVSQPKNDYEHTPGDFIDEVKTFGVTDIIRLNEVCVCEGKHKATITVFDWHALFKDLSVVQII